MKFFATWLIQALAVTLFFGCTYFDQPAASDKALPAAPAANAAAGAVKIVPKTGKIVIVLAGDSTVNAGSGWGPGFAKVFNSDRVQTINLALNGRSSKSFIAEGQWKKCLAADPDIVLIQFGHNDQPPKGPERETDPQTTYKQYLTQYIDESRAIGAMPILITSLERRGWQPDGKIKPSLTDYAVAVRQLGLAKNVPVIDLNALSIAFYEKIGKEKMDKLSATAAGGTVDNTHLNSAGADAIGPIVAAELVKIIPQLSPLMKQ